MKFLRYLRRLTPAWRRRHAKILQYVPIVQAMAALSRDPSTKVGAAVIDDDFNLLASGRNDFPRGVKNLLHRYLNKSLKYKHICHAEMNAVAQAARVGARLHGATMVLSALYPCTICTRLMIQAGIKTIYAPVMPADTNPLWVEERALSKIMLDEAGIEVIEYRRPT